MVTSLPMAAAPLAMMKAAMALSKSPLKTTMVFFLCCAAGNLLASAGWPLTMVALTWPFSAATEVEGVAGAVAPAGEVGGEGGIAAEDGHGLAIALALHLLGEAHDGAGALQPAGVYQL